MSQLKFLFVLLLVTVCYFKQRECACAEKYRVIPGHTACLTPSASYVPISYESKLSIASKRYILRFHNSARKLVKPPAANMQKMYWSNDLASMAHAWAQQCRGSQETNIQRSEPGKYVVGQNLSWGYKNWTGVLRGWYSEHQHFTLGRGRTVPNSTEQIGHYVQMVYATASKVGCGQAYCKNIGVAYVCNYAGSVNNLNHPYQNSSIACSACPSHCSSTLCDFGGKVCFNGGSLDLNTGKCNCLKAQHEPGNCELRCGTVKDYSHSVCLANKDQCFRSVNVPYHCPHTCKVCPSGGIDYVPGSTSQG